MQQIFGKGREAWGLEQRGYSLELAEVAGTAGGRWRNGELGPMPGPPVPPTRCLMSRRGGRWAEWNSDYFSESSFSSNLRWLHLCEANCSSWLCSRTVTRWHVRVGVSIIYVSGVSVLHCEIQNGFNWLNSASSQPASVMEFLSSVCSNADVLLQGHEKAQRVCPTCDPALIHQLS